MSGIDELFAAAAQVRARAHAPYSRFAVGAAIRGSDGGLYVGCNVENAAYPSGTCAEQNAIGAMIAGGERRIVEIAVLGDAGAPVTPCGACRQRIREFADAATRIHAGAVSGERRSYGMAELLPDAFGPGHLGGAGA
ncbi:MAG: cytidine deaminase [Hyphomicrobiales bacterium]|nr:cytidine deaminase [Hyphomicrobiales bacterium]